ncbi:MAG: hypothetical protein WA700_01010 [Acidobacteriaceae bacterium]
MRQIESDNYPRPRVPKFLLQLPSARLERWLLIYAITFYLLLCIALFFQFVQPSLTGSNDLRIGADSATYLDFAGFVGNSKTTALQGVELVTAEGNLLGPVLVAILARTLFGIALINISLFVIGLYVASTLPGVRLGPFFVLLLLNPTLIPGLLTVNKEIFSLLAVILFVKYVSSEKRSTLFLLVLLGVALLARWEQAAVTGAILFLESRFSPVKRKPKLVLVGLVTLLTVAYPIIIRTKIVDLSAMVTFAAEGSTGPILNRIQASYGFPLVMIPKTMINLFGHLLSPQLFLSDLVNGNPSDIQKYFILPINCIMMLVVMVVVARRKKFKLRDPVIYWCAFYWVITAVSPILQPRYQYPVYVLLCLEATGLVLSTAPNSATIVNRLRPKSRVKIEPRAL